MSPRLPTTMQQVTQPMTPTPPTNAAARPLREPVRRFTISIWVAVSVALVVLLAWHFAVFTRMQLAVNNVFFVPRETTGDIVIVAADDASHSTYGRSLVNWPRALHADLVEIVSGGGARVIAFDVLFAEPADGDDALAEAITRARTESAARTRFVMPAVGAQIADIESPQTINFTYFLLPNDHLMTDAVTLGHTNSIPDPDGIIRWQPTRITTPEHAQFSFAIMTYLSYLRIPVVAVDQLVVYGDDTLTVSERTIPVDERGRMLINFFDAPGSETAFPVYSYHDVLNGDVDPAVFANKIVLVGLMNHTGLTDMYAVPTSFNGETMAGIEIHANLIEQLLQDAMLSWQSRRAQVAVIVLLALFASVLFGQIVRRGWLFGVSVLVVLGLWFAAAFITFNTYRITVDLFYSSLALLLPAPVTLVVHAVLESRRRQRAELLLDSVVTASSQRLSLSRTLPAIAADFGAITGSNSTAVWLWNPDRKRLHRQYPVAGDEVVVSPAETAFAQSALRAEGLRYAGEWLAMPLAWQGEPLGVLVAESPSRVGSGTREMLRLFGWQTSSLIANVLQYRETQQLSELKTRMIRMASHDLKNPLSVILGYTELLQDDAAEGGQFTELHARFLNMMKTASQNMLSIVNEILDLERMRSGEMMVDMFMMPALLIEAAEHNIAAMEQKRQTFIPHIPDDFPPMHGDARQLREAVSNLLSNAQKYTPEGGTITLRLWREGMHARIDVQDTGYGISKEAQGNLFQEFYRVRTLETSDIKGTGLGLSLVKAAIEAHQGRVWVVSEEGSGSTFSIELPLEPDL